MRRASPQPALPYINGVAGQGPSRKGPCGEHLTVSDKDDRDQTNRWFHLRAAMFPWCLVHGTSIADGEAGPSAPLPPTGPMITCLRDAARWAASWRASVWWWLAVYRPRIMDGIVLCVGAVLGLFPRCWFCFPAVHPEDGLYVPCRLHHGTASSAVSGLSGKKLHPRACWWVPAAASGGFRTIENERDRCMTI